MVAAGVPPVSVREWAAWAPGLSDKSKWLGFLKSPGEIPLDGAPDVGFIAPMLGRRMSRFNRMALNTAYSCCRDAGAPCDAVRLVVASRHGDMAVMARLLKALSEKDTLLPADFTNSVHHTAAGYWGLVAKNRQASRSIAGGEASFCYGFLDAAGMLRHDPARPVLLVAVEDVLPEPFDGLVGGRCIPYSVALLLEAEGEPGSGRVALGFGGPAGGDGAGSDGTIGIPALDFLRWHVGGQDALEMRIGQRRWQWTLLHPR